MSKYAHLANHLSSLSQDQIRLSFAEIEVILGESLPASASQHNAWWANSRTQDSHTWAHLWLKAGWEVNGINLDEQWVKFFRVEYFDIDSPKAREGYELDRSILARARNSALSNRRKELDNYTCQVCLLRLQVGERWVIEVHHLDPLSDTGETQTSLNELVSLCPTCHRIAHLRNKPFTVEEIKALREKSHVAM